MRLHVHVCACVRVCCVCVCTGDKWREHNNLAFESGGEVKYILLNRSIIECLNRKPDLKEMSGAVLILQLKENNALTVRLFKYSFVFMH